MTDTTTRIEQIRSALREWEWVEAEAAVDRLRRTLAHASRPPPVQTARTVAKLLRGARRFDALASWTETMQAIGVDDAQIARQRVQALIDGGRSALALRVLDDLEPVMSDEDLEEALELAGLRGRAHKQLWLDQRASHGAGARRHLDQAIDAYRGAYERAAASPSKRRWLGINAASLLSLVDGEAGGALAREVLGLCDPDAADVWLHATSAEAHVLIGDADRALTHLRRFLDGCGTDAFAVAGTLRQFRDVLRLHERDDGFRVLVELLQAQLMVRAGGGVRLLVPPAAPSRAPGPEPARTARDQMAVQSRGPGTWEASFGDTGAMALRVLETMLGYGRAVARVLFPAGGSGTCFLTRGAELYPAWGDRPVIVTSHHVLNADGAGRAARPERAVVEFAWAGLGRFGVSSVLWSSRDLDVTVATLDGEPAVKPLRLCRGPDLVLGDVPFAERPRVYVFGHAYGAELAVSVQNNRVLAADRTWLQYRAPTEKGSSGGPVFDDTLELVAVHHAGGEMPRLGGKGGVHHANEGVLVSAIRRQVAVELSR